MQGHRRNVFSRIEAIRGVHTNTCAASAMQVWAGMEHLKDALEQGLHRKAGGLGVYVTQAKTKTHAKLLVKSKIITGPLPPFVTGDPAD